MFVGFLLGLALWNLLVASTGVGGFEMAIADLVFVVAVVASTIAGLVEIAARARDRRRCGE